MINLKSGIVILLLSFALIGPGYGRNLYRDRKINLNEEGTHYLKGTLLSQVWLRQQEYNPGTTIFDHPKDGGWDIGIRRFRMQLYGQLTDRVFVYSQIGQNNFNNSSDRKSGLFVHDITGEYALDKRRLSLGMGLTGWSGLSRFSSPATGSILGLDAPLFLQTTNDVNDQFLRKLSVYAKGKLGKFDYRLTMAQPMAIQKSAGYVTTITEHSVFSLKPPKMQWNGYVQYQFLEEESNLMPYMAGTYLGKKKILNAGLGFICQPGAMVHAGSAGDTIETAMLHFSADLFYDAPTGSCGQAISIYGNATYHDFGPGYLRNQAVMNPANGSSNAHLLNGGGNGFPAYGTGMVFYTQAGYKFRDSLVGNTTLMPYAALQHATFDRLSTRMNFIDVGVNWLLAGQTSKFTLSYQNRPLYNVQGDPEGRRGAFTMQYQVFLN